MFRRIRQLFQAWYERRINFRYGVMQFVANIAFLQMKRGDYLILTPPSKRLGEVKVICKDLRPMLSFQYWEPKLDLAAIKPWQFPHYEVIVELEKFQYRRGVRPSEEGEIEWEEWDPIHDGTKHPVIWELRDLFLAQAFYSGIRKDHVKNEATSL